MGRGDSRYRSVWLYCHDVLFGCACDWLYLRVDEGRIGMGLISNLSQRLVFQSRLVPLPAVSGVVIFDVEMDHVV